ncbi:uncharacterized protein LOC135366194 [Ornithodoros turicata]|uniref:uncharacterized protein LOC135366194 n=1 Tax=Ornithodoros turicata TaxID=34597 RepID=UPI00313A2EA5
MSVYGEEGSYDDQDTEAGAGDAGSVRNMPGSTSSQSVSDSDPVEVLEIEESRPRPTAGLSGAGDALNEIDGVQVVISRTVVWVPTALFFIAIVFGAFAAVYLSHIRSRTIGHIPLSADDAAGLLSSLCNGTACRSYSRALGASLNRSRNPCDDFYSYVCDGWVKHTRYTAVEEVAKDKTYKHILDVALKQPDRHNGNSTVVQKVAGLIRSCLRVQKGLKELQQFLADRRLPWPRRSTVDIVEILVDLSANWGLHLWFQIVVLDKTGNISRPAIELRHSETLRTWMVTSRTLIQNGEYDAYITKVLSRFHIRRRSVPYFINQIKATERLILSILGPVTADHSLETRTMTIEDMAKLTPGVATLRWVLAFADSLSWARAFTRKTLVRVEGGGFLRAVAVLLSFQYETVEALSLSLGFHTIHEIGWIADRELRHVSSSVMRFPNEAAARRCLVLVEDMTGPAWFSLLPPIQDLQNFIAHIVLYVNDEIGSDSLPRLRFLDAVGDYTWHDHHLPELQKTFFASWVAYHELQQTHQRKLDPARQAQPIFRQHLVLHRGAIYNRQEEEVDVLVGREFLIFPLYYTTLPKAVIYAGAGRLIADEIIRAYGAHGGATASRPTKFFHSMEFAEESPTETRGLLASLRAYQSLNVNHVNEDSVVFPDQLFFMASCYALCASQGSIVGRYGPSADRCMRPIKGLSEFKAAFRCGRQPDVNVTANDYFLNYATSATEGFEPEMENILMKDVELS